MSTRGAPHQHGQPAHSTCPAQLECAGPLLLSPLRNSPLHVYCQSGCTATAICTTPAWVTAVPPPQGGCQREQASPTPRLHAPGTQPSLQHQTTIRASMADPTDSNVCLQEEPGSTKATLGKRQRQRSTQRANSSQGNENYGKQVSTMLPQERAAL